MIFCGFSVGPGLSLSLCTIPMSVLSICSMALLFGDGCTPFHVPTWHPASSVPLIYTTWSASERRMSWTQPSTLPQDTLSIGSCYLGWPTPKMSYRSVDLVNDVLRDTVNYFVFVYLDDTLIFSHSLQVHIQHVRQGLQWLLENQLYVKAEKWLFIAVSAPFLGFIISVEGICVGLTKVRNVSD